MRILLLTNKSPWPPKDGGAAATLATIQGLTHCGASVSVIALNTRKHYVRKENISPAKIHNAELKLIPTDTATKPISLLRNLLFSDKPYSLERFESEELRQILSIALNKNFDIVQIEGLAMARYAPLVREHSNSRIIYRPHNIESRIWSQLAAEEKNFLKRYYFRILAARTERFEREAVNFFDGIAPMTKSDLEWFTASGVQKPSVVCHSGFPFNEAEYNDGEEGQLCFIGSLDWRPNINGLRWFLENVWSHVSESVPSAMFHVAGRNPSKQIEEMCRCRGVVFHGEVESSADFIRDKRLIVVPLFSGSGVRMKIIEGMNMGKSIVATPVAANGIDCHDGKDIFIREKANDFARCVIRLLGDQELRKVTAKNAIGNVRENYNIFASAEKLMKFYSQLT